MTDHRERAASSDRPEDGLMRVLTFISDLTRHKLHYEIACHRANALMVLVTVPGERWEIEFMADGAVEIERFRSDGTICGEETLAELWKF